MRNTIQRSDLLKTREPSFFFVWHMDLWTFTITLPYLGEVKVSTVNSDLTNFIDVQRSHENIKLIMYF